MGKSFCRTASRISFTKAAASSTPVSVATSAVSKRPEFCLNRNSSSNWSITTSRFSWLCNRACRVASISPRPPRRSVASRIAICIWESPPSSPNTPGFPMAAARLPIGSPPGRNNATRQPEPAWLIKPPSMAGSRPARTKEDLPLPEDPITARKRDRASLLSKLSI